MLIQNREEVNYPWLKRQLALAYFYVQDLGELIEKAHVRDFPSESPTALLRLLRRISNLLEEKLIIYNEQLNQPLDDASIKKLQWSIRAVAIAGVRLAAFIRYVEAATVENIPWGLVGQLRSLCGKFDPTLHLIVRSRWSFLYDHAEAKSELSRAVAGDLDVDSILIAQPFFLILSFPKTERNNMLQHAVWGHEIAHVLQQILAQELAVELGFDQSEAWPGELTLSSYLARQIEVDREEIDSLLTHIQREHGINSKVNEDPDLYEEMISLVWNEVAVTLNYWVTEIVCDLLAIRLFGPAALFAFYEIVEPLHDLTRPTDTHPPPVMRMRIMIEELHALGFINIHDPSKWSDQWDDNGVVLGEEIKHIEKLCTILPYEDTGAKIDPREREAQIRFQIVSRALNHNTVEGIRDFIRGIEREYFLDATKLQAEVSPLIDYLENGIPPNKVELTPTDPEPASLPAILNAGWIYWLALQQRNKTENSYHSLGILPVERKKLNKLVLKAIEASEIQRLFSERKNVHAPLNMV